MLGLNSKCWKLGDSDNSVYFRRRAKWYQTKPNCLRMSSHFLRTKPVCQNWIYGRVENWINLSPFIRYNVFISTHTANVPFAWKTRNLYIFSEDVALLFRKWISQERFLLRWLCLSTYYFVGISAGNFWVWINSWFTALCASKLIVGEV